MQIAVNYLTCFKVLCNLQSGKIRRVVLQNTFLQKTTTCTGLQAEQIFSLKKLYIYIYVYVYMYR